MNVDSHEVQWWQATFQVNEEVDKHMYFIFCWAKYRALAILRSEYYTNSQLGAQMTTS
jgi:hypothetical protein